MTTYIVVSLGQLIDTDFNRTLEGFATKTASIEQRKGVFLQESSIFRKAEDGKVNIKPVILQTFQQDIITIFRVNGFFKFEDLPFDSSRSQEQAQQEIYEKNKEIFRNKTRDLLGVSSTDLPDEEFDNIWCQMCVVEQGHAERFKELLGHPHTIFHSAINSTQAEYILKKLKGFSVEIPSERLFLSYAQRCEYKRIEGKPNLIHKIYELVKPKAGDKVLLIQSTRDTIPPVFQPVVTEMYDDLAKTATELWPSTTVVVWNNKAKDSDEQPISLIKYLRNNNFLKENTAPIVGLLPQLFLQQENSEKLIAYLKNTTVFKDLDPNNLALVPIINSWNSFIQLIALYKNDQSSHDFKYSLPNLTEKQKFLEIIEKIDGNINELQSNSLSEKQPLLVALYGFKSSILRNLNRYADALESCQFALNHLNLEKNKFGQAIIYSNIAGIYNASGKYDDGLKHSTHSYNLIKTQLEKSSQENDFTKIIMGCVANTHAYSLRKTKTSEADALNAAEIQRLAHNLYSSSNVVRNNLAITLTKATDEGCLQQAIQLLEEQLQFDKQAGRYLFVTPYYLADAYIRLAFLQLSKNPGRINNELVAKGQKALDRATESLMSNKSYEGVYKQKAEARVTRLRGVINRLLGDKQAAENCAVGSKALMLKALGVDHPKLNYFNKKVDDSITAEEPRLFFNHIPS